MLTSEQSQLVLFIEDVFAVAKALDEQYKSDKMYSGYDYVDVQKYVENIQKQCKAMVLIAQRLTESVRRSEQRNILQALYKHVWYIKWTLYYLRIYVETVYSRGISC